MPGSLSAQWRALRTGRPGHRFRERYRRGQEESSTQSLLHRVVRFSVAAVAFSVGLVLVVIPGPAIPFFLIAGALVAADWLWMARTLDWLEVRLRKVGARARRIWGRLPRVGRVVLVLVGAACSAASTYTVFRLLH